MLSIFEMKEKEVINISDGEKLGYIYDFEIDTEQGKLTGIILPGTGKGFGFFSKANDKIILWDSIIKIGTDTILVNVDKE